MSITVLELAKFRGLQEDEDGKVSMTAFDDVGLPMMGGCSVCGATVACYNSCPSKSGFLKCVEGCIGDDGWETVEEANRDIFGESD